jgi:hypothetical protein
LFFELSLCNTTSVLVVEVSQNKNVQASDATASRLIKYALKKEYYSALTRLKESPFHATKNFTKLRIEKNSAFGRSEMSSNLNHQ